MKKSARKHNCGASLPRVLGMPGLLILLACAATHCLAQSVPKAFQGVWQVSSVLVDTGATRTLRYQNDDDRLKGRIITIGADRVTTDLPEDKLCAGLTMTARQTTAGALIGSTMGSRGAPPEVPTPKDYELGVSSGASIEAWWVSCTEGNLGPGREGGAWIIALPNGQLAMRWYDLTILRLARLPENAKPQPSFNCAKAALPAERAICASLPLAAFDRSVADSYSYVVQHLTEVGDQDALKRARAEQRAWLPQRNACGADAACLQKSMETRLQELSAIQ
jgi:uncharacterized protein YecT (DUF1311 family)